MSTIWAVMAGRAELLEAIERFVADVKADPRAWSRESPGDISAFGSTGGGYSMEVALRIALTGEADDESDATVRLAEETWDRLAANPDAREEHGVEGVAHSALRDRVQLAVRSGSAGMRDYFTAARCFAFRGEPDSGLLLMIGHAMWSKLQAIAQAMNDELGLKEGDPDSWDAEGVARAFLDDAAHGPGAPVGAGRAQCPAAKGRGRGAVMARPPRDQAGQ